MAVSLPNNTTLTGAGRGTLIQLGNFGGTSTSVDAITNTDQINGTGITIQDLRIDGLNSVNTLGSQHGIYLENMGQGTGASALQGAKLINLWVNNFEDYGIYLISSFNNTLTSNAAQGNTIGFNLDSSSNNTFTGNTSQGNDSDFYVNATSNNTFTGNTSQGNFYGFSLEDASNNTFTGNTVQGNDTQGFIVGYSSSNNTFTGNTVQGNGGMVFFYLAPAIITL